MAAVKGAKRNIAGVLKLQAPAGKAAPSPPLGPALGQRGLNIMEFCKAFNARTASLEAGAPVTVLITYYADRRFTFEVKTPPTSYYLKKAAGVEKASSLPGRGEAAATVTMKQINEIAAAKREDLNAADDEAAARSVMGSARSLGFAVEG